MLRARGEQVVRDCEADPGGSSSDYNRAGRRILRLLTRGSKMSDPVYVLSHVSVTRDWDCDEAVLETYPVL